MALWDWLWTFSGFVLRFRGVWLISERSDSANWFLLYRGGTCSSTLCVGGILVVMGESDVFVRLRGALGPNELLTPCDRIVLGLLVLYASPGVECWPSREQLAVDSGLSLLGVKRSLSRLRGAGLIVSRRHRSRVHPWVHRLL